MATVFTLDDYKELINRFLETGYVVRTFENIEPEKQHLLLRHDIDMSIDIALQMAKVESEIGVNSTYFVLLRSQLYNPLSSRGLENLNEISALGHNIGLHFDAALYDDSFDELEKACATECDIIEAAIKEPVGAVSFHRPAKSLINRNGKIAGRLQAYDKRYIEQIGYCSDSRGQWHYGSPFEQDAVINKKALQLLTHPIWWVGKNGESIVERLDSLANYSFDNFRAEMADNCEPYKSSYKPQAS